MTRDSVTGWKLPREERDRLLQVVPPLFVNLVADHVTLRTGTGSDTPLPQETSGVVAGEIDDGEGVQALVVEIGGGTARGDGGTYHITWSLAAGRKAKESNDVIGRLGWRPLPAPVAIGLQPARWARSGA
jgi:hypothetical protein